MDQVVDTLPEYGDPVPPPVTANTYKPLPGSYANNDGPSFDFETIDTHARKASLENTATVHEGLIMYLEHVIRRSIDKDLWTVRGILVWLGEQDIWDSDLELATMFTTICRKAKIKCVTISGLVKASGYQPGDTDLPTAVWNAVKINGNWHIVFPLWVLSCIIGAESGGYKKLEHDGEHVVADVEEREGCLIKWFRDTYFLVRPEYFIYQACAFDPKWQLLPPDKVRSEEEFKRQVRMRPEHFEIGMQLLSNDSCVLKADGGMCSIKFRVRKDAKSKVKSSYELFVKETSVPTDELLESASQNRFVFSERRGGDIFRFEVRFSVEGIFKLKITFETMTEECNPIEFRLECTKRKLNCRPLPIDVGDVGWGPGPKAKQVGLLKPSQPGGRIRVQPKHVVQKENKGATLDTGDIKLSFQLDRKSIGQYDYRAQLSNDVLTDISEQKLGALKQLVRTELSKGKGQLVVLAKVPDTEEYALTILAGDTCNKEKVFKPVCHYLLSDDVVQEQKEMQDKAVDALRTALISGDEKRIHSRIVACEKAEVDMSNSVLAEAILKLEAFAEVKEAMKHWVSSDLEEKVTGYRQFCIDQQVDKGLKMAEKMLARRKEFDAKLLLIVKPLKETLESLRVSLQTEGRKKDALVNKLQDKVRDTSDPDFAMGISVLLEDVV